MTGTVILIASPAIIETEPGGPDNQMLDFYVQPFHGSKVKTPATQLWS